MIGHLRQLAHVQGTWLTTRVFGGKLMQLQYTCMQREGDLRFEIVRTRENAGTCPKQTMAALVAITKMVLQICSIWAGRHAGWPRSPRQHQLWPSLAASPAATVGLSSSITMPAGGSILCGPAPGLRLCDRLLVQSYQSLCFQRP